MIFSGIKQATFLFSIWRCRGFSIPGEVSIRPTLRCNLQCKMCFQRNLSEEYCKEMYESELSLTQYTDLIGDLSKMGVRKVRVVGGGEPLMRKDSTKIISAIKKYGLEGCMTTNGTLFTEELVEKMVKLQWDEINFSVDAPTKEIYEYIRGGKDAFQKVSSNMRSFAEMKKKYKSKNPTLRIHTVIMKPNLLYFDRVIELAHQLGLDLVTYDRVFPHNPSLALEEGDKSKIVEGLERSIEKAKVYSCSTNAQDILSEFDSPTLTVQSRCYKPWLTSDVQVNGDVHPCCYSDESMGNVKEQKFSEIWDGERYNDFREKMLDGNFPDYCKNCDLGWININKAIDRGFWTSLIRRL